MPVIVLRPTWERLKQSVFLRRDLSRRLHVLCLVERKMLQMLARTHYYQRLLRLGIAGLWLASQLRLSSRAVSPRGDHRTALLATGREPPRSHVAQVLRRAW